MGRGFAGGAGGRLAVAAGNRARGSQMLEILTSGYRIVQANRRVAGQIFKDKCYFRPNRSIIAASKLEIQ